MEAAIAKADLKLNAELSIPAEFLLATISARQVVELTQSAENLLEFNLSILLDHLDVIELLHAAFKKVWPKKIFIKLGSKEDLLRQVGITLPDVSPSDSEGLKVYRFEVN